MISFLSGKVINKSASSIILAVGGVGYRVFISPTFFSEIETGKPLDIYTHQHVREDSIDLFGFRSPDELAMFDLLISISGIGPKSALAVLSIASVADLQETIARGDSSLLVKVSGIGKKTAERIILELREKIGRLAPNLKGTEAGSSLSGEEIDALMALGYSLNQAREALRQVDPGLKDSGERIRHALKKIGK